MTRRRVIVAGAVALAVLVLALGWWRRAQLVDQTAAARSLRRTERDEITRTAAAVRAAANRAATIEADSRAVRAESIQLTAVAEGIAHQVESVQRERDDAALAAYYAGGRLRDLRACLDGIERALNQVSVGDPGAAGSLGLVESSCRAAGA